MQHERKGKILNKANIYSSGWIKLKDSKPFNNERSKNIS